MVCVSSIKMPACPDLSLLPSTIIATGLNNPRGMLLRDDGCLWLVEAGTGNHQHSFSGRVLELKPDPNHQGAYLSPSVLASGFRSMNLQSRMCRDEVMGLSDIEQGDNRCLVSYTDFVEGSKILDLSVSPPEPVFYGQGNINALCYHRVRNSWIAVKPDSNQLVEFVKGDQQERVLADLPTLSAGQDAVPVTLVYEPSTQAVLISLFSGELHQNPDKKGIDFAANAGRVIRCYPDSAKIETVISGLNFPTGLALVNDAQLLVLELCEGVLEPLLPGRSNEVLHGGFQRFSGRLIRCHLHSGDIQVLAAQLDTPSNLCVGRDVILLSEGMGLPGRLIPHSRNGTVELTGCVRALQIGNG
jgi:hypothetical protein